MFVWVSSIFISLNKIEIIYRKINTIQVKVQQYLTRKMNKWKNLLIQRRRLYKWKRIVAIIHQSEVEGKLRRGWRSIGVTRVTESGVDCVAFLEQRFDQPWSYVTCWPRHAVRRRLLLLRLCFISILHFSLFFFSGSEIAKCSCHLNPTVYYRVIFHPFHNSYCFSHL